MSKRMYVKDSNGKYILTEKDRDQKVKQDSLTIEDRLLRLERIVLDPRK